MSGLDPAHQSDAIDPDRRAAATLDDIHTASREWRRQNRRPRALSARDALLVLRHETLLVGVAAANVACGVELSDVDRERLLLAVARIGIITDEAIA